MFEPAVSQSEPGTYCCTPPAWWAPGCGTCRRWRWARGRAPRCPPGPGPPSAYTHCCRNPAAWGAHGAGQRDALISTGRVIVWISWLVPTYNIAHVSLCWATSLLHKLVSMADLYIQHRYRSEWCPGSNISYLQLKPLIHPWTGDIFASPTLFSKMA